MQPNVLVCVMDAARASNFSAYGHERETSPNVDQLATNGRLFERAVPPAPATFDSVTSVLSGTYPCEHQSGRVMSVNTDQPLLPELLSEKGYTTGFATSSPGTTPEFGYGDGVDRFYDITNKYDGINVKKFFNETRDLPRWQRYLRFGKRALGRNLGANLRNAYRFKFGFGSDDGATDLTDAAKSFVADADEPWFLYVHYTETHLNINGSSPYILPDEARTRFVDGDVETGDLVSTGGAVEYSPDQADRHERIYDGAIRYLDGKVGELVGTLKDLGQFDRTLLTVTSDHGEALGEHGHLGHAVLDEPVMDIPLILHGPGVDTGEVSERVNLIWLYRTLTDLVDNTPAHASGVSLLSKTFPEYVLSQNYAGTWDWSSYETSGASGYDAFYRGNQKLVSGGDTTALYDVAEDPAETTDLSDEFPDETASLVERLREFRSDLDTAAAPDDADIDEQTKRRLQELGYLE